MIEINGHKFHSHWGEEALRDIAASYKDGASFKDIMKAFREWLSAFRIG